MKTDKFAVGEVVNSDGHIGSGVNFEVIELLEDQNLRIKLTKVNGFWVQRGLRVEQEHVLEHIVFRGQDYWVFQDKSLPQFALSIDPDGKKKFIY